MTATLVRPTKTDPVQPTPPPPRDRSRPRPPRRRPTLSMRSGIVRAVALSIAILGALVLGFGVYLAALAPVQQSRTQSNLYKTFAGQLALATAPVDGAIPIGAPVAILRIPQLDVTQVVVQGTSSAQLTAGPGHRRDTVLPGQAGVSVLLGRSGLFGAPFSRLGELRTGDLITVTTGAATSSFKVTGLRDSTQLIPPPSDAAATLVLSTAAPPLAPTRSLIVTADLTSPVQAGAPVLSPIGTDERALSSDTSAALPLMLWLQALLLLVVAAVWSFVRWERWPTYIIATPMVIAVLWCVYENASQLLPNTM